MLKLHSSTLLYYPCCPGTYNTSSRPIISVMSHTGLCLSDDDTSWKGSIGLTTFRLIVNISGGDCWSERLLTVSVVWMPVGRLSERLAACVCVSVCVCVCVLTWSGLKGETHRVPGLMWDQGGLRAHLYLRHVLLAPGYSSTAPLTHLLYRETQARADMAKMFHPDIGDLISRWQYIHVYIRRKLFFLGIQYTNCLYCEITTW